MLQFHFGCICVLVVAGLVQAAHLPKTWKICKKNSADLNECVRGAIELAVRDLSNKGNSALGVLPLEPLRFTELKIGQGKGPVSISLDFNDLKVYGFKEAKINRFSGDGDLNKFFEAEVTVPKLTLNSKYKIDGKVLILPITGEGDCQIVFTNFKAPVRLDLKTKAKDGKQYYEVADFKFKFTYDKVHLHFENLFNGDKALGDNMNIFLNENSKEILQELSPAVSTGFGSAFKIITNQIFSKVPINEIFP